MKTVQHFSPEYLQQCRKTTIAQRLEFLENFRRLHDPAQRQPSQLISLRVPHYLLQSFRQLAAAEGKKYQSLIKELMSTYVSARIDDSSEGS